MHSSIHLNRLTAKLAAVRTCCLFLAIYLFLIGFSVLAVDQKPTPIRTFKLKVVIDENYRTICESISGNIGIQIT